MSGFRHAGHDWAENLATDLDRVLQRNGLGAAPGDESFQATTRTPFDELAALEDGEEADGHEERWAFRLEGFRAAVWHLSADGVHPLAVLKRFYATMKAVRPELLNDMSMEDISLLCGDKGRATVSARIKRVYNAPVEKATGRKTKAACQKGFEAKRKMADSATGNQNRKRAARRARKVKGGKA